MKFDLHQVALDCKNLILDDERADRFTHDELTVADAKIDAICELVCSIAGHYPIMDQCGMPEHDHCLICGVPLPGQAPREVKT